MNVYYNEHDPFAAAWLRELIADGHIPAGRVDRRDIRDIRPDELDGYDQAHFFAGIAGWVEALRLAGLSGLRGVWTGSCPCQSFSAAGRQMGFADERHLWPSWFHLIEACRPRYVMGEQVASKLALEWLDLVHDDLEGAGYAVRAADLGAASVGAPHIRQRLWFVADASEGEQSSGCGGYSRKTSAIVKDGANANGRSVVSVADDFGPRLEGRDARALGDERATAERGREAGELADAGGEGRRQVGAQPERSGQRGPAEGLDERSLHGGSCAVGDASSASAVPVAGVSGGPQPASGRSSPWSDLIWLPCRDGRARPTQRRFQSVVDGLWPSMVESGAEYLEPLAKGQKNRVGILRGAGNAIVPQVAAQFLYAALA